MHTNPYIIKKIHIITIATMLALSGMVGTTASAQQRAGMRMEVAEAETDNGEYSIFTYIDEDGTFGYYMGLGRVTNFLGADEILGMEVKNIRETTIWLGNTADEALTAIASLPNLFSVCIIRCSLPA